MIDSIELQHFSPPIFSNEIRLWNERSVKIKFNQLWNWSAISYSIESMISGFAFLSFLYFGNAPNNDINICLYEEFNAAKNRYIEPCIEISVTANSTFRWVHIPISLSNSTGFCIRIDNHDGLGDFYYSTPQVYSNGGYF